MQFLVSYKSKKTLQWKEYNQMVGQNHMKKVSFTISSVKTESPIKWNKNISYLICLALFFPLLTIKKTLKKDVRLIWPPPPYDLVYF